MISLSLLRMKLPVHRNVLQESSHYFQCMFEWSPGSTDRYMEVKNTPLSVVMTMISYIYGEDINSEWNEVMDYIDIIEMWQMQELKYELEDYIISNIGNINVHNWIQWLVIAQRYHMGKLELQIRRTVNKIIAADAPTKLQACINTILENKTTLEIYYKDTLHIVGLRGCSAEFIDGVINIYKNTLTDIQLREVKPFMSMLPELCSKTNLGMKSDSYTVSEESTGKVKGREGDSSYNSKEDSETSHSIFTIGDRLIAKLNINKELSEIDVEVGNRVTVSGQDNYIYQHTN